MPRRSNTAPSQPVGQCGIAVTARLISRVWAGCADASTFAHNPPRRAWRVAGSLVENQLGMFWVRQLRDYEHKKGPRESLAPPGGYPHLAGCRVRLGQL